MAPSEDLWKILDGSDGPYPFQAVYSALVALENALFSDLPSLRAKRGRWNCFQRLDVAYKQIEALEREVTTSGAN